MLSSITIARSQPAPTNPSASERPLTATEQKLVGLEAPKIGDKELGWFEFRPTKRGFSEGGSKPVAMNDMRAALMGWGGAALDKISGQTGTKSLSIDKAGPLANFDMDGDKKISPLEAGTALFAMTASNVGSALDPMYRPQDAVRAADLTKAESSAPLAKQIYTALQAPARTPRN